MNKELIKKYKAEFDHWLNGGNILVKMTTGWSPVIADYNWHLNDRPYVIKDEYVEFRKALAEGKTVQEQDHYSKQWLDMKTDSFHKASDTQYAGVYRIKPEELKFKVGDWVRDLRDNRVFQINSVNFNLKLSTKNTVYVHWQPKKGEWCWFSNKNGIPTIGQFLSIETDGNRKYSATFPNTPHPFITYYDYCEPFLGQLPTNIQEAL